MNISSSYPESFLIYPEPSAVYMESPLSISDTIAKSANPLSAQLVVYSASFELARLCDQTITSDFNNCFEAIPNYLREAEILRHIAIQQLKPNLNEYQPHLHAQQVASSIFFKACVFSTDSKTIANPDSCLEALTAYIEQADKTSVVEQNMAQDDAFDFMQNIGIGLRSYQRIYKILLGNLMKEPSF